jgi:hypothetical protein
VAPTEEGWLERVPPMPARERVEASASTPARAREESTPARAPVEARAGTAVWLARAGSRQAASAGSRQAGAPGLARVAQTRRPVLAVPVAWTPETMEALALAALRAVQEAAVRTALREAAARMALREAAGRVAPAEAGGSAAARRVEPVARRRRARRERRARQEARAAGRAQTDMSKGEGATAALAARKRPPSPSSVRCAVSRWP